VNPVIQQLAKLDRRWIFLLMGTLVMTAVLLQRKPPESPTTSVRKAFDYIENLPPRSTVLVAGDFDPSSAPELEPMFRSWLWHLAEKEHKIVVLTLWLPGRGLIGQLTNELLRKDRNLKKGEDYVYLGFKTGNEVVIKAITKNLKGLFANDDEQDLTSEMPILRDFPDIRSFKLIMCAGAGYPGYREWIQYATTPYSIPFIVGCTGVQASALYPYYPTQALGILPAIKGAAEYETLLRQKYPHYGKIVPKDFDPKTGDYAALPDDERYIKGLRTMGPQLWAHMVVIGLIVFGNIVLYLTRMQRRG
jgi:hypothetical protein